MKSEKFFANYADLYSPNQSCLPDTYKFNASDRYPKDGFIVARNNLGKVVSTYADNIWDFTWYRLAGDSGSARINFDFAQEYQCKEAKWLVFLLLYVAVAERSHGISISSLMGYIKPIRKMFKYTHEHGVSISEILANQEEMNRFVASLGTRNLLSGFSSILRHMIAISESVSGYKVIGFSRHEMINLKIQKLGEDLQHPVIPPRIFSTLISQLDGFLAEINSISKNLWQFLNHVLEDEQFARSTSMQRLLGNSAKDMKPFFFEASAIYGIDHVFIKYGVSNIPGFSKFLTRVQHACRLYIHIYSGMRHSEALSLKINSLEIAKDRRESHYKFQGETSKFVGQKKRVSWTTSEEVLVAYKLANELAQIVAGYADLNKTESPLFLSMTYLSFTSAAPKNADAIHVSNTGSKLLEVYEYLESEVFRITDADYEHLERVDPFRAWHEESAFRMGAVWRFTTHQFRRSLAFYVSQSANVSLPALKRQLKHLSREMTLYYCNASSLAHEFDHDEHISHLIKRDKPEFDAIAYLHQVLNSDEPMYGAHGRFVERNIKNSDSMQLLKTDRKSLVQQFKKGEIAYKETPLGACTTTCPCDKKLLRVVAACVSCERAIIKPSKLERVVARQTLFVEELAQMNVDSIELRTERAELEVLRNFQTKVIARGR